MIGPRDNGFPGSGAVATTRFRLLANRSLAVRRLHLGVPQPVSGVPPPKVVASPLGDAVPSP